MGDPLFFRHFMCYSLAKLRGGWFGVPHGILLPNTKGVRSVFLLIVKLFVHCVCLYHLKLMLIFFNGRHGVSFIVGRGIMKVGWCQF